MLKITVLKKTYFRDLIDEYAVSAEAYAPCEIFEEGQTFITDGERPEQFCDWAWENIRREMNNAEQGQRLPWVNAPGTFIACCTDGFRPVVFKIEKLNQQG